MRNPQRIAEFLVELTVLWQQMPDLRFFQLLAAIQERACYKGAKTYADPFYVEDDVVIEAIRKWTKEFE